MRSKRWYGLIGLLSLLGFVGVFTPERAFLGFVAFAVDFQYFFIRADEMETGRIQRSAALGFFAGMTVSVAAALGCLLLGDSSKEGLYPAFAMGWGVAVAVYALSGFWWSCKEWWYTRT